MFNAGSGEFAEGTAVAGEGLNKHPPRNLAKSISCV